LFSPKIFKADGKTLDSTGLILSRYYRFFDRGHNLPDRRQYDGKPDIFGPCAAAALYKKEMLEDVKHEGGYFDESFFFLGEDFDIAWRAGKRGWRAKFVPGAVCYHLRNSTNFASGFRQYLSFRNRYFMLLKNQGFSPGYITVFLLYDIPRFFYMLFTNRHTLKGVREIINYRRDLTTRNEK
jgi:GT2 family glycosyltransferase